MLEEQGSEQLPGHNQPEEENRADSRSGDDGGEDVVGPEYASQCSNQGDADTPARRGAGVGLISSTTARAIIPTKKEMSREADVALHGLPSHRRSCVLTGACTAMALPASTDARSRTGTLHLCTGIHVSVSGIAPPLGGRAIPECARSAAPGQRAWRSRSRSPSRAVPLSSYSREAPGLCYPCRLLCSSPSRRAALQTMNLCSPGRLTFTRKGRLMRRKFNAYTSRI